MTDRPPVSGEPRTEGSTCGCGYGCVTPHQHHDASWDEAEARVTPPSLDYGETWERWQEFADMAARAGSGFTQDQITGAAAMLTWLIDHEGAI